MPIPPVALKRRNHRLLLCDQTKKPALLAQLIATHQDLRIAVVTAGDAAALSLPGGVAVLTDAALPKENEASFDLVISYDLPAEPQRYLERLALCDDLALTLLGEDDRERLLAVEMLLGRAISQERPDGFAPAVPEQPKHAPKRRQKPGAPQRNDAAPKKAPFNKEAKPPRKPKASGVSRYLGTDENGKPIFSGKTGERNHRKDGKPHTEESLAAKKEWEAKRKQQGGKKPYDANKKPPFKGENDRRKPFDNAGEARSSEGGEKKAYADKKPAFRGEKKPYDAKAPFKGNKKPFGAKGPAKGPKAQDADAAKPKRPPRRIKADAFKPTEPKK